MHFKITYPSRSGAEATLRFSRYDIETGARAFVYAEQVHGKGRVHLSIVEEGIADSVLDSLSKDLGDQASPTDG